MNILAWIRAMRLQTLPVAATSMLIAIAAIKSHDAAVLNVTTTTLCFVFAMLAQIASNFANEYYDFKNGGDTAGREGFRRGVAEGDISPKAMKCAAYATMGLACVVGLCLVPFGGLKLIPIGIAIAIGAFAYSAGPYPLSHHGLGEVAVVIFFGIVPVCATFYLSAQTVTLSAFLSSLTAGFLAANVLIVNNYRDYDDDSRVGKRTLAVVLGRNLYSYMYMLNVVIAVACIWAIAGAWLSATFFIVALTMFLFMKRLEGRSLNKILIATSLSMLLYSSAILSLV